jgi:hypothetical protein
LTASPDYGTSTARGDGIDARIARLEVRVEDLDKRTSEMGSVALAVGILTEKFESMSRDMKTIAGQLTSEIISRDTREKDNKKERRDIKVALWTFTVMIVCALIGAVALILTTAHT